VTFSGVSISVLSFGATKAIGERSERGARTAFTAFILTPPSRSRAEESRHRAIFILVGEVKSNIFVDIIRLSDFNISKLDRF
jgi:hypothetical protein